MELLRALRRWFNNRVASQPHSGVVESSATLDDLRQEMYRLTKLEEMPRRVDLCEQALKLVNREQDPEQWVALQNTLGISLWQNPQGDRAENLERAIAAYEAALQIYTRDAFPQGWAMTQNNLSIAYSDRIRGDRADNLERAIAAYKAALQVYTRDAFPQDWAMTQNNLGNAYSDRIRGDRAENLERAISAYEAALQIYTRDAFPQDWAMTQNNLGGAYSVSLQGERVEKLERAISACEAALQVYTREAFPQNWATTQGNLAGALMERAQLTDSHTDLDRAIHLLQAELEVAAVGSSAAIDGQYRLGNALSRRYEQTQDRADLEQAIQAYQTALQSLSPEHYDRQWMWKALPEAQLVLGSRLLTDGKWQEGLQLLLNSLNQLSQTDDWLTHASALFQTGRAHELLSNLESARLYYRDALRLYKHLEYLPGIARSKARLGSVLVSQGFLAKGIAELTAARQIYAQLQEPEQSAELDEIYHLAQQVLARQTQEAHP